MIDDVRDIAGFYDHDPQGEHGRLERHQLEHDLTWRYLNQYLPSQGTILEVGAATGRYTLELARRGYMLTAVDLSAALIEKCRKNLADEELEERVRLVVADARDLGEVKGRQFDAALLMGPLYHLVAEGDRKLALSEVFDRLRTGGILFSSFISRLGIMGDLLKSIPAWIEDQVEVQWLLEEGRRPDEYPRGGFRGYFARVSEIAPLHEAVGFETLVGLNLRAPRRPGDRAHPEEVRTMAETEFTGTDPGGVAPSILMPLPDYDFDPTEAAIPWKVCTSRGWSVAFSTEQGKVPQADLNKLKGPLPGLLSAGAKAKTAYAQMTQDPFYLQPIPYAEIQPERYEALLLPGGDAPRMRQYLESPVLQAKVLRFWQQDKLIGAICHGVLVLARTIDPQTGRSVLYGRKVTALPKSLDRAGSLFDSWVLRRGYLIYSRCVADEVRTCLERPEDFSKGLGMLAPHVISDGNLITARWYMDAELFAERFADELLRRSRSESKTT